MPDAGTSSHAAPNGAADARSHHDDAPPRASIDDRCAAATHACTADGAANARAHSTSHAGAHNITNARAPTHALPAQFMVGMGTLQRSLRHGRLAPQPRTQPGRRRRRGAVHPPARALCCAARSASVQHGDLGLSAPGRRQLGGERRRGAVPRRLCVRSRAVGGVRPELRWRAAAPLGEGAPPPALWWAAMPGDSRAGGAGDPHGKGLGTCIAGRNSPARVQRPSLSPNPRAHCDHHHHNEHDDDDDHHHHNRDRRYEAAGDAMQDEPLGCLGTL